LLIISFLLAQYFIVKFGVLPVYAQQNTPSTVVTLTTGHGWPTSFGQQRKTFYAAGLFWVFYSDNSNLNYSTSSDGSTWSTQTRIRQCVGDGTSFSIWYNGTYMWYAYSPNGGKLYVRMGTPNSNGTITWAQAEQTISTTYNDTNFPMMTVDSNGYVWIAYQDSNYTTGYAYPYVIKSGNNDGTWGTTPAGFPYLLKNSGQTAWYCQLAALTSGKMLVGYSAYANSPFSVQVWNGTNWGAETNTTSSLEYGHMASPAVQGDNVNYVLTNHSGYFQYTLYNYTTNSFSPEVTLEHDATGGARPGATVTIDPLTNILYVFWLYYPTANHVYYKTYTPSNGSWNPTVDWITEKSIFDVGDTATSFIQPQGGYIGLAYVNGTGSPVNTWQVRFNFLVINSSTPSPLSVTLNSPANGASQYGPSFTVYYTPVSIGDNLTEADLYVNWSGTWQLVENTLSPSNNTENSFTYTHTPGGLPPATYMWNVEVWNSTTGVWGASNYTVTILPSSTSVTLNSPANGSSYASNSVTFYYTPVSFGTSAVNASLWTNTTGSWSATNANTTALINNTVNSIAYTFPSTGTYIWNVQVFNSSTGVFAPTNYTLTIYSGASGPGIVGTSTVQNGWGVWRVYQRKTFYANNMFWAFYDNGSNMVYCTSPDGITWSSPTTVRVCQGNAESFSVWFNGTYVYYAYAYPNNALYYRVGIPSANGIVTWLTSEQTVPTAFGKCSSPMISVDTNGYVWITYQDLNNSAGSDNAFPYVIKSGNNDGTWGSTPAGFPYQLSLTGTNDSHQWKDSIIPLTGGKMLAVYCYNGSTVKVQAWNGSVWGPVAQTNSTIAWGAEHSEVAQGDNVHMVLTNQSNYMIYTMYNYTSGSFTAETTLQSGMSGGAGEAISINPSTNDLYVFWGHTPLANTEYYRQYLASNSTWLGRVAWITEASALPDVGDPITCFYQSYNGYIGLEYANGTASPYQVRFNFLNLTSDTSSSLSVTLNTPTNGSLQPSYSVTFYYTPVGRGASILNASLWTNATGSWQDTLDNVAAVVDNTQKQFFLHISLHRYVRLECSSL
jgi:hypothetical protein